MSWDNGDNRNPFLKLKSKLALYHIVLTTPKTSPEKLTLIVVEIQQLPNIEKTDSKKEKSRPKWTNMMVGEKYVYNSRLIQIN